MRELSIKDLLDLVVAEVPDAATRIQKMFEWHFERVKVISQWILGATASLFIYILVAFFKADLELEAWQIILIVLFALCTSTYGIYLLWQLRSLNRQFIAALKLFYEFKKIRPFLIRYREEIK